MRSWGLLVVVVMGCANVPRPAVRVIEPAPVVEPLPPIEVPEAQAAAIDVDPHATRGQSLFEAGRYAQAAIEFMKSYRKQARSGDSLLRAAECYELAQDVRAAATLYQRYLKENPSCPKDDRDRLTKKIA